MKSQFQFTNKWERKYSGDYLRDTFRKACREAEIEPIKLKNATRHSFGMNLISQGHDFWKVSKTMGHSTTKMTENYVKMVASQMEEMYGRERKSLSKTSLNEK